MTGHAMTVHLLGLPNAQTTKEYSLCGFTQATIRFGQILHDLGHEVYLYASEENIIPCKELITCIHKEEINSLLRMGPWKDKFQYQYAHIEEWSPLFQIFNSRAEQAIAKRKQPRDIICQIGGYSQKYVSENHKDLQTVEWSIGYLGSFSDYRIFESSAWMHSTYGMMNNQQVRYYDDVIPCPIDPDDFHFTEKPEDYFVFVGRLTPRKGVGVACDIATRAGVKLKIIGHGEPSQITGGHEYLGPMSMKEKNEVMSKAIAMIAPTQYIEPHGVAQTEAQISGVPLITTNAGGFMETIEQGKTGFRCSTMKEFVAACKQVETLDRNYIRKHGLERYSMHNLKHDYQRYFERLKTLWTTDGWYSMA